MILMFILCIYSLLVSILLCKWCYEKYKEHQKASHEQKVWLFRHIFYQLLDQIDEYEKNFIQMSVDKQRVLVKRIITTLLIIKKNEKVYSYAVRGASMLQFKKYSRWAWMIKDLQRKENG